MVQPKVRFTFDEEWKGIKAKELFVQLTAPNAVVNDSSGTTNDSRTADEQPVYDVCSLLRNNIKSTIEQVMFYEWWARSNEHAKQPSNMKWKVFLVLVNLSINLTRENSLFGFKHGKDPVKHHLPVAPSFSCSVIASLVIRDHGLNQPQTCFYK